MGLTQILFALTFPRSSHCLKLEESIPVLQNAFLQLFLSLTFWISGLLDSVQLVLNQTLWHCQLFCLVEDIYAIKYTLKHIVWFQKHFWKLEIKHFQLLQHYRIFAFKRQRQLWPPGPINDHQTVRCNLSQFDMQFNLI